MVPLNKRIKRPCYYLAGYVLNNEVTLKLRHALSDTDIPVWQFGGVLYPSTVYIQKWIRRDLGSKRSRFKVDAKLFGSEERLETIIATQGGYALGGSPPPEAVEGELQEIIREWLQNKGNPSSFFDRCFLTLSIGISRDEYRGGSSNPTGKHRQSSFPSPSSFGNKASDSTVFRNRVHSSLMSGTRVMVFIVALPGLHQS